jgi:hypothetical protein
VALVEVVAGADRRIGVAQLLGEDRVALEADVQRLALQRGQREHLAAHLEDRQIGAEREFLDRSREREAASA